MRYSLIQRGRWIPVACLLVVMALPAAEPAQAPAEATMQAPAENGLETFDKAWIIIRDTHFDPTLNGVDWDAVREELRPKAATADKQQLRGILRDMLSRLGQSHFALIPSDVVDVDLDSIAGDGDLGMEVRMLGDELVVSSVEEGEPAWNGGIRPGWFLRAVGERKVAEVLQSIREHPDWRGEDLRFIGFGTAVLSGEPGSTVALEMEDGDGETRTVELTRRKMPGKPVKLGNLPPFLTRFESRELHRDDSAVDAGLIDFNAWMLPVARQFDDAVDRFRQADGIIVDLRGNPGGVGGMVMGIAGHFYREKVNLGTFSTRTQTLKFNVNPRTVTRTGKRVEPYAGPVAILMDRMSASTSEMFGGGMQETGRAKVFGRPSAGMILPAYMDRLPNGDVLYHAIADYKTPAGILLEGKGVIPDVTIPLSRSDLLAGRDRTLEAALDWIAAETKDKKRRIEQ